MRDRKSGYGCKMFLEMPSLTPLASHCNRGTRTKSAILGSFLAISKSRNEPIHGIGGGEGQDVRRAVGQDRAVVHKRRRSEKQARRDLPRRCTMTHLCPGDPPCFAFHHERLQKLQMAGQHIVVEGGPDRLHCGGGTDRMREGVRHRETRFDTAHPSMDPGRRSRNGPDTATP